MREAAHAAQGPAGPAGEATCPKCGSMRTAATAQVEAASRRLNLFRCETCHSRFVQSSAS